MRILFFGTPDFSCPTLTAIYEAGHEICGVITQTDKPKHRGQQLAPTPVKVLALEYGLTVYQPKTLRDGTAAELIRELAPELGVVVAYGKILPLDILEIPKFGCINLHPSLLPLYQGAAPVQHAVLDGHTVTGISIMQMSEGMDTGDILTQVEREIFPDETAGQLLARLSVEGAELMVNTTIPAIADGTAIPVPQDQSRATHAKPLTRDQSPVDWSRSATEICNQIRGLNPWPMATAVFGDKTFKLHQARVGQGSGAPGTVLSTGKEGLEVACGAGSVFITTLQAPGKKATAAADYLRGNPIG